MLWMKEPERLKSEMPAHLKRVADRFKSRQWIYRNEKGRLKTIGHDLMNVPVEAAKIDPYFAVHWLIVLCVLTFALGVAVGLLVAPPRHEVVIHPEPPGASLPAREHKRPTVLRSNTMDVVRWEASTPWGPPGNHFPLEATVHAAVDLFDVPAYQADRPEDLWMVVRVPRPIVPKEVM